jgi:DNA invertase Pin-like site-specific DNA recombinase
MRIGYARVSTDDQTLDLQRDALKRAKCRQIYEEHASGKTALRPELEACLKSLRKGDTLVVWRLDRLGRSLGDLIHLTTDLRSRGVNLESLTEKIETGSSAGKLIFQVFASLAEFERNLIRERTLAGLKAARARGRNGGRPRKLRTKDIQVIKALMHAGELPTDLASRDQRFIEMQRPQSRLRCSRHTQYRPRQLAKSKRPKMAETSGDEIFEWPCLKSNSLRRR